MPLPPEIVQTLRRNQARSAAEQRLLSGRGWLLVAACVQLLAALHPLHQYIEGALLHDPAERTLGFACVTGGMVFMSLVLLALWWWSRYAPFRAALAALVAYVAVHAGIALLVPQIVLDGIASKIIVLLGLILAVRTGWLRHKAQ